MKQIALDNRLLSAASLVRPGVYVADIGTDHAYLPIYLCQAGIVPGAVAADINLGPLQRASAHIRACGLDGVIETRRCDGLQGLEQAGCRDYVICGMGGELIARILAQAPFIQNSDYHLILQPMTAHCVLRQYLWENGFSILQEKLSKTDRIYQVFSVQYTGQREESNYAQRVLGKYHMQHPDDALLGEFLAVQRTFAAKRFAGKRRGGQDTAQDAQLLDAIDAMMASCGKAEENHGV